MAGYGLMLFVAFSIFMSLRVLFQPHKVRGKFVSLENFLLLVCIYVTTLLGFGLLFLLVELNGAVALIDSNEEPYTFFHRLETSLYFSAMTLFSVGYGDVVPVGAGRLIAVIEALIGYTIPAAFVARAVKDLEH